MILKSLITSTQVKFAILQLTSTTNYFPNILCMSSVLSPQRVIHWGPTHPVSAHSEFFRCLWSKCGSSISEPHGPLPMLSWLPFSWPYPHSNFLELPLEQPHCNIILNNVSVQGKNPLKWNFGINVHGYKLLYLVIFPAHETSDSFK